MVRNIRRGNPKANQALDIVSEIGRPLSAARNAPVNTPNTAGKGRVKADGWSGRVANEIVAFNPG
jgi:hypothetical protein